MKSIKTKLMHKEYDAQLTLECHQKVCLTSRPLAISFIKLDKVF